MLKFLFPVFSGIILTLTASCTTQISGSFRNFAPYPIMVSRHAYPSPFIEEVMIETMDGFEYYYSALMALRVYLPATGETYNYIINPSPKKIAFYENGILGAAISDHDDMLIKLCPNEDNWIYLRSRKLSIPLTPVLTIF